MGCVMHAPQRLLAARQLVKHAALDHGNGALSVFSAFALARRTAVCAAGALGPLVGAWRTWAVPPRRVGDSATYRDARLQPPSGSFGERGAGGPGGGSKVQAPGLHLRKNSLQN
jgi:hypothetical protein